MKSLSIYIHIPFCIKKCNYCDFNSYSGYEKYIPEYFDSLIKELDYYKKTYANATIQSIYIGGGTPGYVASKYIQVVIEKIDSSWKLEKSCEITIETNPGVLDTDKANAYVSMGVNRISIGVQSFDDTILKDMGRVHNAVQAENAIEIAKKAGIKNISLDLMFGIPNQSIISWKETIIKAIHLQPKHISCYGLKFEEGTPWGELYHKGELRDIDDVLEREMYYLAQTTLSEYGYNQYEISNFALPGLESFHNSVYWRRIDYVGVGAGAHSYIDNHRKENIHSIVAYIENINKQRDIIINNELISKEEAISETIILGLRMLKGIDIEEINAIFDVDILRIYNKQIQKLFNLNLISCNGKYMMLTKKGLDFANVVFVEFI